MAINRGSVYYIRMVQPKTAPVSIRIPPELLAAVDAWAKQYDCARHAALVQLLGRGLAAGEPAKAAALPPREKPAPARIAAAPTSGLQLQIGPVQAKPGERFKKPKK